MLRKLKKYEMYNGAGKKRIWARDKEFKRRKEKEIK